MKKWFKIIFLSVGIILILFFVTLNLITTPSNDREWNDDQKVLPYSEINENIVKIHNIRNFKYASTTSYEIAYYDKTFDLDKIKNVYYVVEPFSDFGGSAHTFLTFEFEGDNFVAISVEIRKEKGEVFSALKGLLNQYEIMYVIADERDVVKLRSNYRKDKVYVYPAKTTKEKMQSIFADMLERANKLTKEPEFYNTLTNTCTTNIVKHVNRITPEKVPFSYRVLFPGYSDKLAYDLGLINTDLSFEETRSKYLINARAEKYADSVDFSRKIREVEIVD